MKKALLYFAAATFALSSCKNVTTVTLDKSELTIAEGQTIALTATVLPNEATNKAVTWSSTNADIAAVNDKGKITARGVGTAIITAKAESGKKAATCIVTVGARVTGITLDYITTALTIGDSLTLTPTVIPHNAVYKTVSWISSNPNVATVDTTGTITALSFGKTTITAATQDGNKKATCLVIVTNEMIMILTVKSYDVWFGIVGSGTATIDWGDGTAVKTVTLSSDDKKYYDEDYKHSYSDNDSFRAIIITGRITKLTCSDNDPSDSYFKLTRLDVSKNPALIALNCSNNQLTNLDVSKNIALTELNCSENQLASLDVSENTALNELSCSQNLLTSLDVSKNTALTTLTCAINQLTNLDVSKNTLLSALYCYANPLTNLDVSKNATLEYLLCSNNQLTSLDVSKNTALIRLDCGKNQLTRLDMGNNTVLNELDCTSNQLKSLDMGKNIMLKALRCSGNQLTSLDMSKNTELRALECSSNQLKKIDMSQNTALRRLVCNGNQLTSLDVSQNVWLVELQCNDNQLVNLDLNLDVSKIHNLMYLSCHTNQLTNLDVSKNMWLVELNCNSNQLTNLNVSNTQLRILHCQSNKLTAIVLNALFEALPAKSHWEPTVYTYNNPGTGSCNQSIATNKGWTVVTSEK